MAFPLVTDRTRRPRPALVTDLPLLVVVLACWLLLPLVWAHVATGVAILMLVVVHLRTRPSSLGATFARGRGARRLSRRVGYAVLLVGTAAMIVSGVLRWVGLSPQTTFHAGASYLFLTATIVHVVIVRRALVARLRPRRLRPAPWFRD